jgi:hypothetical protein
MQERREFMIKKDIKLENNFEDENLENNTISNINDDDEDIINENIKKDEEKKENKNEKKDVEMILTNPKKKKERFIKMNKEIKKIEKKSYRDEKNFINYERGAHEELEEEFYKIGNDVLDINGEDHETFKKNKNVTIWDKKKKKFVQKQVKEGEKVNLKNYFLNESGKKMKKKEDPHLYEKWKLKTKKRIQSSGENEDIKEGVKFNRHEKPNELEKKDYKTLGNLKTKDEVKKDRMKKMKVAEIDKIKKTAKTHGLNSTKMKLRKDRLESIQKKLNNRTHKNQKSKIKIRFKK